MIIIDVRTPEEYQESHIKGAINFPLGDLQENSATSQQVTDRLGENYSDVTLDTPLKLHCASGGRSSMACVIFRKLGFTDVENLGGFNDACKCVEGMNMAGK
ncbi:MAG: rhodanese-like domain-containing protein [Candidatus Pacebacteria bacterium]|nr:rhodanese-like domain-containing protein [Candidatus Paceibacterota bacterium]